MVHDHIDTERCPECFRSQTLQRRAVDYEHFVGDKREVLVTFVCSDVHCRSTILVCSKGHRFKAPPPCPKC